MKIGRFFSFLFLFFCLQIFCIQNPAVVYKSYQVRHGVDQNILFTLLLPADSKSVALIFCLFGSFSFIFSLSSSNMSVGERNSEFLLSSLM